MTMELRSRNVFRPVDKKEARKKLKIPPEKKVLITSLAGGTKNPQKGGRFLLAVARQRGLEQRRQQGAGFLV